MTKPTNCICGGRAMCSYSGGMHQAWCTKCGIAGPAKRRAGASVEAWDAMMGVLRGGEPNKPLAPKPVDA